MIHAESDAPKDDPIAVLLGGGVESTVIVSRLLADGNVVQPIRVNCGLIWDAAESRSVQRFYAALTCDKLLPLIEIDLPLGGFLVPHWAVTGIGIPQADDETARLEIPLRNLTLLAFAVQRLSHLPRITIATGTTADNSFRDGSRAYFDQCQTLLSLETGRPVTIITPFIKQTKTQVIREADPVALAMSFSCVNPNGDGHCGACIKCGRRRAAFVAASVPDPTAYASEPEA